MEYRWLSQVFAIMDLVGCVVILGICGMLGYITTYDTVSQNAPELDAVSLMKWLIYAFLVYCCYIIIESCINVFRATLENADPGKVCILCFHWSALSWTSFVLASMKIIIGISSRHLTFPSLFGKSMIQTSNFQLFIFLAFTIFRGAALFCIHKYKYELKSLHSLESSVLFVPIPSHPIISEDNESGTTYDANRNSLINPNFSPGYNPVATVEN